MSDYSLKTLASGIEFEPEEYAVLLELFLDTTTLDLNDISTFAGTFDKDLISSSVHNIKGAALNLELNRITELMDQLSKLNKSELFSDIEKIVNKSRAEISLLREVLEKK